ncbi:hypothetical protein XI07_28810 [Bradyrhizobium sp. CCBAU 11445]|nr:hypothetical protein [Bradyrhizobium sp. CCBAU 25360]MDA9485973.1 hypothetical protein [Bradyrhizobium sp. CCBAU 11445]
MRGTTKCDAIANDVRSTRLDRSYVSGCDLGTPHSIDKLQPGDGTTLIVGAKHDATEDSIAQNPRYRHANTLALLFESERHRLLVKVEWTDIVIASRQQRRILRQTKFTYSVEVAGGDWTDCRLSAS